MSQAFGKVVPIPLTFHRNVTSSPDKVYVTLGNDVDLVLHLEEEAGKDGQCVLVVTSVSGQPITMFPVASNKVGIKVVP